MKYVEILVVGVAQRKHGFSLPIVVFVKHTVNLGLYEHLLYLIELILWRHYLIEPTVLSTRAPDFVSHRIRDHISPF